jgi:glycerol-3-phosphate dehydrogenase (NAD(P)+)
LRLAAGESLHAILQNLGHVAEGVSSARSLDRLAARMQVDMPIAHAVSSVLEGRIAPAVAVTMLLERSPRSEF